MAPRTSSLARPGVVAAHGRAPELLPVQRTGQPLLVLVVGCTVTGLSLLLGA